MKRKPVSILTSEIGTMLKAATQALQWSRTFGPKVGGTIWQHSSIFMRAESEAGRSLPSLTLT
ncbi:hypothetical protein PSYMP_27008 [Pseudomonas amygdali pv. morsprunorum str. M302280]|nr:hypothetical protein PSYMP_27008 [Pseudomonas amygdali pv. morsprunorum str. M302280]